MTKVVLHSKYISCGSNDFKEVFPLEVQPEFQSNQQEKTLVQPFPLPNDA